MQLLPFTEQDTDLLISWIPDATFNLLWGGPLYHWPLTPEQIRQHQQKSQVHSFLLESDGNKIGFVELYQESPRACRLCRVLIAAPAARGQGHGQTLLRLAIGHAREVLGAEQITLAVFEHNQAALNCYRALGFDVIAREPRARQHDGQWWPLVRMQLR